MANHMEEVARMLGVEIGERFRILGHKGEFAITENGLEFFNAGMREKDIFTLNELLCGKSEIIKKPWKPKCGGEYWTVNKFGIADKYWYYEESIDIMFRKLGNFYRTQAEAKANADRWKAWYSSDERVDVFNG